MTSRIIHPEHHSAAVEAHLLGHIDFDRCVRLQRRIAGHIAQRDDGQICLLLGEHTPVITVGRGGSASEIRAQAGILKQERVEVRWVKRGGGSLIHAPGQLFVYPIVPLRWYGFTVGDYLDRLQAAVFRVLESLRIPAETRADRHGLWGRTGQMVALGVAVRQGVTCHGAVINVCPPMGLFRLVQGDPVEAASFGSLVAERGQPVKMTSVRIAVVREVAEAFGCQRYHLHTGHPLLRTAAGAARSDFPRRRSSGAPDSG